MKLRICLLASLTIVALNAQTRALSVNTRHVMLNHYNAGNTKFIRYGLDFSFGTGEEDLEATVKDSLLQDSVLYDIDTKLSSADFGLGFQKGRRIYNDGKWGVWGVWTVRLVSKFDRSDVFSGEKQDRKVTSKSYTTELGYALEVTYQFTERLSLFNQLTLGSLRLTYNRQSTRYPDVDRETSSSKYNLTLDGPIGSPLSILSAGLIYTFK